MTKEELCKEFSKNYKPRPIGISSEQTMGEIVSGKMGFTDGFNKGFNKGYEKLLTELIDIGVIKSWYYNGEYHWELAE